MLHAIRTYTVLPGLVLTALAAAPLSTHAAESPVQADATVIPALAGVWKAKELRVPAASDLDKQVWGAGAEKVRRVQLALEPDGGGTLRVESSVVDAKGQPKKYSQSVVEARLQVREPKAGTDRVQPEVTVVSAEERYLDDPKEVRRIEGLRLRLDLLNMESPLNIFYETPEGNGSFGETLQRVASRAPARSALTSR